MVVWRSRRSRRCLQLSFMPSSSSRPPAQAAAALPSTLSSPQFPFARYASIVGVHTSLLAFSALLLPTTGSFKSILSHTPLHPPFGLNATTSATYSKRDVLEVIAEHPTRTAAWICLGALVVQSWWASWLRGWSREGNAKDDPPRDGAERAKRKMESVGRSTRERVAVGFAVLYFSMASRC